MPRSFRVIGVIEEQLKAENGWDMETSKCCYKHAINQN
jgi:hypothetical protein